MNNNYRRLQITQSSSDTCASKIASCGNIPSCMDCFMDFDNKGILFTVSSTTSCDTVMDAAITRKICKLITGNNNDKVGLNAFCDMFDACKNDFQKEQDDKNKNNNKIDCTSLTECN